MGYRSSPGLGTSLRCSGYAQFGGARSACSAAAPRCWGGPVVVQGGEVSLSPPLKVRQRRVRRRLKWLSYKLQKMKKKFNLGLLVPRLGSRPQLGGRVDSHLLLVVAVLADEPQRQCAESGPAG
jgi:hypothetical protein